MDIVILLSIILSIILGLSIIYAVFFHKLKKIIEEKDKLILKLKEHVELYKSHRKKANEYINSLREMNDAYQSDSMKLIEEKEVIERRLETRDIQLGELNDKHKTLKKLLVARESEIRSLKNVINIYENPSEDLEKDFKRRLGL